MAVHKHIVSFWAGKITWLERLSVQSLLANGHSVEIFSAEPKAASREFDCKVSDVAEVISENEMAALYRSRHNFAFYADMVRLELLRQAKGTWSDLDCVYLSGLTLKDDFIFGLCGKDRVNNAVLSMPVDSKLLSSYYNAINTVPLSAPWATYHIRAKRRVEIMVGKTIPFNPNKLAIGPRALTYFIKKHSLMNMAQKEHVFYPVSQSECLTLISSDDRRANSLIQPDTICVHAWRSNWMRPQIDTPPPAHSSFLGRLARLYA